MKNLWVTCCRLIYNFISNRDYPIQLAGPPESSLVTAQKYEKQIGRRMRDVCYACQVFLPKH